MHVCVNVVSFSCFKICVILREVGQHRFSSRGTSHSVEAKKTSLGLNKTPQLKG